MKFNIIVADAPFVFNDKLQMSQVKRSSSDHYKTLSIQDIKNLDIPSITADDALLALWVPGSMVQDGLDIMKAWGFKQKQVFVWVKTKKEPLGSLIKDILKLKKKPLKSFSDFFQTIKGLFNNFSLSSILNMGLGHTFRQSHEIALIGTKGKISQYLQNRSQRSVIFDMNYKHSQKPEGLQDALDLMFPDLCIKRAELFARRQRKNWLCTGLECPGPYQGDIRDMIKKIQLL